jgi:hypothetical protein
MAEEMKKVPMFGHDIEVADVPIKKATEFFNEYELEDGSVLRVKSVATAIYRIEGQFVQDRPVYLVLTSPAVNVTSSTITAPSAAKEINVVKH